MSVLAYVVLGGSLQDEPAATQALTYILKSRPEIAQAFVGLLRDASIEFEPGRVEAELGIEGSRPDLTIHDSGGRVRVFVENKFWAPLTDAQPVSYLRDLPEDPPSALMFIVPEQRVTTVWSELGERCRRAELEWEDTFGYGFMKSARIGSKTLLLASWKVVLERLVDAARSAGHDTVRDDIHQLQGLTSQMDSNAFLPLRENEVSNQEAPRRLIGYVELIDGIVDELKHEKAADTEGLSWGNTIYSTGRFFHIHADGRFESWLGIDLRAWREEGISPLWWRFGANTGVVGDYFKTMPGVFNDVRSRYEGLYVPIRLKTGVERDRVISDAVTQMTRIADKVLKTVPNQKPALC